MRNEPITVSQQKRVGVVGVSEHSTSKPVVQDGLVLKKSGGVLRRTNSYAICRVGETLRGLFFMTLTILIFSFCPVGHRPYWKRAHRDWHIWAGMMLVLAAMMIYWATDNLAGWRHIQAQQTLAGTIGK